MIVEELDVRLPGARVVHAYRTGDAAGSAAQLAVVWHHGTPNIGTPPAPLFAAAERLGLRWIGYDRPGYGGSTPVPDRSVASAADDVAAVLDALGVSRCAVVGHSGGGPHALACAALLPERVVAAVSIAGLAPFGLPATGGDGGAGWFEGMGASGAASLRAALEGREVKERHEREAGAESEPEFTPADLAALGGAWSWFGSVVAPALADGPAALIDDDLAYVSPWGFDPADIRAPVLLVHGTEDRIVPAAHSSWLHGRIPRAELWMRGGDSHISVMRSAEDALAWVAGHAG